jgi:hypothetical protein
MPYCPVSKSLIIETLERLLRKARQGRKYWAILRNPVSWRQDDGPRRVATTPTRNPRTLERVPDVDSAHWPTRHEYRSGKHSAFRSRRNVAAANGFVNSARLCGGFLLTGCAVHVTTR